MTTPSSSVSGCSSKLMHIASHLQVRKASDLVNARVIQTFVWMRVHALTLRPDGAVIYCNIRHCISLRSYAFLFLTRTKSQCAHTLMPDHVSDPERLFTGQAPKLTPRCCCCYPHKKGSIIDQIRQCAAALV